MPTLERSAQMLAAVLTLAACDRAAPTGIQPSANPTTVAPAKDENMKIKMHLDGEVLTATLAEGAAPRDFLALLPLELTLRDYASTEKVGDLPARLSIEGAPPGFDPDVGDITYYAPWGNLAIFYRDFGFAQGLVKLGRFDSNVDELARKQDELNVRFERAQASTAAGERSP